MKNRNLILVIIFVALLATYFLMRKSTPVERKASLFGVDSTDVKTIELIHSNESIKLTKTDSEWFIVEPIKWNADELMMQNLFDSIIKAEVPLTVIARGSDSYFRYGLDDENALQVLVYNYKKRLMGHVYFGNSGAPNDYLRRANDDRVYQIKDKVKGKFAVTEGYWRDPRVLRLYEKDIKSIDITHADQNYSLIKESDGWRYRNNSEDFMIHPENRQLMRVLNILHKLETRVFLDGQGDKYAENLKYPFCEVRVNLSNGNTRKLTFIKDAAYNYLMLDDDPSVLYAIMGDTIDRFIRSSQLFKIVYDFPE